MISFVYLPVLCSLDVVAHWGPLKFGNHLRCWTLGVGPVVAALLHVLEENLTLLGADGLELWQSDLSGEGGIVGAWLDGVDLSLKDLRRRQIIFIVWTLDDITPLVSLIIWLFFYTALLISPIKVSILIVYCGSLLVHCRSLIVYCRSSQLCKARFIGYAMIIFIWVLWLFLSWMICWKLWQILFSLNSSVDVAMGHLRYLSIYRFWRSRDKVLSLN